MKKLTRPARAKAKPVDRVARLLQAAESVIADERRRTPDEGWWTAPYRRLSKAIAAMGTK